MPLIFLSEDREVSFDDERLALLRNDQARLTSEEREFLVAHVPTYPTCDRTEAEMRRLPDSDIVEVAFWTMDEYAQGLTLIDKL